MRSWTWWVLEPFKQAHALFVEQPLRQLYFKGPALLGFWSGLTHADICTSLNPGTSAIFWTNHASAEQQCALLVEQRFHAFFVSINVVLYVYIVYRIVATLAYYVFVVKPALKKMEQVFKHVSHVDAHFGSVVRSDDSTGLFHRALCRAGACEHSGETPRDLHDPARVSGGKQGRKGAVREKVKSVYCAPATRSCSEPTCPAST